MNDKLLQELSKPFAPASISWLPGSITKDKTKALALAYADLRAYMNRLDEVCGLGWSVAYTPWANKLICHLTIEGVTRSSVGEPTDESEKGEIDGTVTEAQAFKRACVMFGLGRYLYNFPQSWQPIDEYKHFTKEAQQKLAKMVHDHYQRSLDTMAQAQHRTARPPQDVPQNVSRETFPPADDDVDFGMGEPEPMAFDEEPPIKVRDWLATPDPVGAAKKWAVACKAQPNEHAARNSFAKIVEVNGGRLTKDNMAAILTAYYFRQQEHLEAGKR